MKAKFNTESYIANHILFIWRVNVMSTNSPIYYTVKDLLLLLPIGRNSVYRLVNQEGFPKVKVGKKIIIPAVKFHEWFESNLGQVIDLGDEASNS